MRAPSGAEPDASARLRRGRSTPQGRAAPRARTRVRLPLIGRGARAPRSRLPRKRGWRWPGCERGPAAAASDRARAGRLACPASSRCADPRPGRARPPSARCPRPIRGRESAWTATRGFRDRHRRRWPPGSACRSGESPGAEARRRSSPPRAARLARSAACLPGRLPAATSLSCRGRARPERPGG